MLASDATTKPRILGKTEVVKNTLSPSFVQRIEIEYEFGKLTHFTVAIFDAVSKKKGDKSMYLIKSKLFMIMSSIYFSCDSFRYGKCNV